MELKTSSTVSSSPSCVYAYCEFNDSESGLTAKKLVEHGDVRSLSIFANQLKESGKNADIAVPKFISLWIVRRLHSDNLSDFVRCHDFTEFNHAASDKEIKFIRRY